MESPLTIFEGSVLVLSNVFLLPSIIYTWNLGLKPEFAILFSMMFTSAKYHLCQAGFVCLFFEQRVLQLADHFMVYSTVYWIVLYFTGLPLDQRFVWFVTVQVFLYPYVIVYADSSWFPIITIGTLVPFTLWILYFVRKQTDTIYVVNVVVAFVLMIVASSFYLTSGDSDWDTYVWTHTFWHIFSMLSIYYVIDLKNGNNIINKMVVVMFKKEPTITMSRESGTYFNTIPRSTNQDPTKTKKFKEKKIIKNGEKNTKKTIKDKLSAFIPNGRQKPISFDINGVDFGSLVV
jgi:hypothetical protein